MIQRVLGRFAVIAFGLLLAAGFAGGADADCEELPEFCRGDYLRIEAAFRVGMQGAEGEEEELRCMGLRNAALAALVERTYASLLVRLTERGDLLRVMEDDQGQWLKQLETLQEEQDSRAAREDAGKLLVERLRVFGTVMSAPLDQPSAE